MNVVLSLDSAYHYKTREMFFHEAHKVLIEDGGRLGLIDIVLDDDNDATSFFSHIVRMGIEHLANIPSKNLVTSTRYKQQLKEAGFENVHMETLDRHILGFTDFVEYQRRWLKTHGIRSQSPAAMWKFQATAMALRKALDAKLLHFVLVSASTTI